MLCEGFHSYKLWWSMLSCRAVELGFKKPKNPNLGFLGFLILLFYFNSF